MPNGRKVGSGAHAPHLGQYFPAAPMHPSQKVYGRELEQYRRPHLYDSQYSINIPGSRDASPAAPSGNLGAAVVAPAAPRFKDRKLSTTPKSLGFEVRNLVGSCLGGENNPPAYSLKNDSKLVVLRKYFGQFAWPFVLHNFHARLGVARTFLAINDLLGKRKDFFGHKTHAFIKEAKGIDMGKFAAAQPAFAGIHTAWSGIVIARRATEVAYDVAADVACHQKRNELQKLLEVYDPITGAFYDKLTGTWAPDPQRKARLDELSKWSTTWNVNDGGNIFRSKKQRALDILTRCKDVSATSLSTAIPNGIATVGLTAGITAVTNASVVVNGVGHFVTGCNWIARGTVQSIAIDNIEAARRNSKAAIEKNHFEKGSVKVVPMHHLCVSAANHMIQERTYANRLCWAQVGTYFGSSASLWAGLFSGGIGYIAASLASFIAIMITGSTHCAWGLKHGRTLAMRRAQASADYEAFRDNYKLAPNDDVRADMMKGLSDKKRIGFTEMFVLDMLRDGTADEQRAMYHFFTACGVSHNTICALKLQPRDKALVNMRAHMYVNRTKFIPKNLQQSHRTLGYLFGTTYMRRAWRAKHASPMGASADALIDRIKPKYTYIDPETDPRYRLRIATAADAQSVQERDNAASYFTRRQASVGLDEVDGPSAPALSPWDDGPTSLADTAWRRDAKKPKTGQHIIGAKQLLKTPQFTYNQLPIFG